MEGWTSLAEWPLRFMQIRSVTFTCCQQIQAVSGRKTRATLTVAIASEVKLHSNADVPARERHLVLDERRVVSGYLICQVASESTQR